MPRNSLSLRSLEQLRAELIMRDIERDVTLAEVTRQLARLNAQQHKLLTALGTPGADVATTLAPTADQLLERAA